MNASCPTQRKQNSYKENTPITSNSAESAFVSAQGPLICIVNDYMSNKQGVHARGPKHGFRLGPRSPSSWGSFALPWSGRIELSLHWLKLMQVIKLSCRSFFAGLIKKQEQAQTKGGHPYLRSHHQHRILGLCLMSPFPVIHRRPLTCSRHPSIAPHRSNAGACGVKGS